MSKKQGAGLVEQYLLLFSVLIVCIVGYLILSTVFDALRDAGAITALFDQLKVPENSPVRRWEQA